METNVSWDPLSMSVAILKKFNFLPEMYEVGYTKVYLRMGQVCAGVIFTVVNVLLFPQIS
jgi:hypothetical protein